MAQRYDVQYVQFYTQGSAARRVVPAAPIQTAKLPQIRKRKVQRIYIDPVATLGIVVAVCMLIMMAVGMSRLQKAQRETAALERSVELLQQENEKLEAQYAAQKNLADVEKTALALGMIPKDEAIELTIQVELPQPEQSEHASLWNRIGTFLTGLFA